MSTQPPERAIDSDVNQAVTEALRTKYWVWIYYSAEGAPSTLQELLYQKLPHIAAHSWDERFHFGGVYINGIAALGDQPLTFPCRVEYYEPKFAISEAHLVFPAFRDEYITYRDDHIAVVYKPPALSSMPAKEQRHFSLKAYVEKALNCQVHMPSRLDVSAQGIVIMSISHHAHANLQKSFENRRVVKTYLCASHNDSTWLERSVDARIGRDPSHPVLRTTRTADGQSAATLFQRLGQSRSEQHAITTFSAQPITGRTHQIRVHAASEGIALVGDRFYAGAPASYLHLISYAISCEHPISREICRFTLPDQFRSAWVQEASSHLPLKSTLA